MKNIITKLNQANAVNPSWNVASWDNREVLRKYHTGGTFSQIQQVDKLWIITLHHEDGGVQCAHWLPSWKQMVAYLAAE